MNVLLVGEFSGVHTNLKAGLEHLGVQVTLANTGDGFKKFSSDMLMWVEGGNWSSKLENKFLELYNLYQMKKFDVIQIMHPNAFEFYTHSRVYELLDQAKLVVQLIGGCDYAFEKNFKYLNEKLCQGCRKYDLGGHQCYYKRVGERKYEKEIYKRANIIVPLSWEYYYIYKEYEREYIDKLQHVMPMPIDLRNNRVRSVQTEKIRVFHPLNREGFKGTNILRPIFRDLQMQYGDIADFKIEGKMPIAQYRKFLSKTDIVVDQLYCNSYGMNALYSMAMGKVVFSGNSTQQMFKDVPWMQDMPILSVGFSEEEIKDNIIRTVRCGTLSNIKKASRRYVETYHDAEKVAKLFLRLYRDHL